MLKSPYEGLPQAEWTAKTEELLKVHPLSEEEIKEAVFEAWKLVFDSKIGGLQIGKDIFPAPQIMSFLLHELIPHTLSRKRPGVFKVGKSNLEKDIHYVQDPSFSIEVKASSNTNKVFGNRSYAQPNSEKASKSKDGYLLTVNFKKFKEGSQELPVIGKIRFGYVEHTDWKGQESPKGQQASLNKEAYSFKLKTLYSLPKIKKKKARD